MPLRLKIVAVLGALVVVYLVVCHLILRNVVSPIFDDLEARDADRNLARVERAIQALAGRIDALNSDWAVWDDTYEFVQGRYEGYLAAS